MKRHYYLIGVLVIAGAAAAQDPQTQSTTPSKRDTTTATSTNTTTEMKMQTYKGTLMDASCAMGGAAASTAGTQTTAPGTASSTAAGTGATAGAERNTAGMSSSSETHKSKHQKGEANRSESAGQACSVSSNTSEFALKLDDGRTVKFDSVGNLRAQDALKNKKWQDAASSGKPIQAKVKGAMLDDKLLVDSIH